MKNLIGMTDFVLEQRKEILRKIDYKEKLELYANIIYYYANFLKQPLELWMFVPCDEDGDVLDAFVHIAEGGFSREYQQAKERCLFDGFDYQQAQQEDHYSLIRFPDRRTTPLYPKLWAGMTIEDLIKYNLQLTPSAIKQLQS